MGAVRRNKRIYDERPGYRRVLLETKHYCGRCDKRIGRFATHCHHYGEKVEQ